MSVTHQNFGEKFFSGAFKEIYYASGQSFQQLVTLEQFTETCQQFNEGVESYSIFFQNDFLGMKQTVWLDDQQTRAIHVTFQEDLIMSLSVKPYVVYPESDTIFTKNTYRLPFNDEWFVFWGGTNEFVNYHYAYETQRYAYDFVKVENDQTFRDTPNSNENYYAFGADVVAPFKGTVVTVVDGFKDNVPGEMDETNPAGNYIVIAHPNDEYSILAHFTQGSICVKEGEFVKEGQLLGQCGNSGNSSEAHIHFHVMDGIDSETATSIRIKLQGDVDPLQGETVKPIVGPDKVEEVIDKADTSFTIADFLLFIPRIIGQFIKG